MPHPYLDYDLTMEGASAALKYLGEQLFTTKETVKLATDCAEYCGKRMSKALAKKTLRRARCLEL